MSRYVRVRRQWAISQRLLRALNSDGAALRVDCEIMAPQHKVEDERKTMRRGMSRQQANGSFPFPSPDQYGELAAYD
ncbi:unnamed protein product [Leptosia nina]|uniref:Uncharacterized protein n=1 Tax=Leptosia nina TaxID=320188 RepID=A0AAV1J879_9NEOP